MKLSLTTLFAAMICMSSVALASDKNNLCVFHPHPTSENVSLPADEAIHYPSQWTGDPLKINLRDTTSGLETAWKASSWDAYPINGGPPVRVDAFRMFAAAFIPSPFLGGELGWVRVLMAGFLGPDGIHRHYLYIAPGEFEPRQDGYDLTIGGPDETLVFEVLDAAGNLAPVANPNQVIAHGELSGGIGTDDWGSADGVFRLRTFETSLKAPIYPFDDGFDPEWRYYWIRPWIGSWGTLTFGDQEYVLAGASWEEREWQFSIQDLVQRWQERHSNIQIHGCLTASGRKYACEHSMRTILSFDIRHKADHSHHVRDWSEVGPPPFCIEYHFSEPEESAMTPLDYWVSPHTGITYARTVRLTNPARQMDLLITTRLDDQELYKAAPLFPGGYEGAADVEGTIGNKRVYGRAYLEAFNHMP